MMPKSKAQREEVGAVGSLDPELAQAGLCPILLVVVYHGSSQDSVSKGSSRGYQPRNMAL